MNPTPEMFTQITIATTTAYITKVHFCPRLRSEVNLTLILHRAFFISVTVSFITGLTVKGK